jgi:hypothetical protein
MHVSFAVALRPEYRRHNKMEESLNFSVHFRHKIHCTYHLALPSFRLPLVTYCPVHKGDYST